MANRFSTSTAIPCRLEEPETPQTLMPVPASRQAHLQATLGTGFVMLALVHPAATPFLVVAWVLLGFGGHVAIAHEEHQLLERVVALAGEQETLRGRHHPLVISLRRYARILRRLSDGGLPRGARARIRLMGLAERLARRCEDLMELSHNAERAPLLALADAALPPQRTEALLPMTVRARRRRQLIRRV